MAMDVFREAIISLQKVKLGNVTQKDCADWGLENVTLRKHQLEGVKWLAERYQCGHGCILGDEMGLGKTLQSITLLSYLKKVMKVDEPFLVVCPLSVVSGWESEFKRGLPCFKVLNYCSGKEERAEIQNKILPTLKGGASPPFDVLLAHYEVYIVLI
jgi:SNF2 family DNA or RNA helicase